ncbi:MAG TPA: lasso peptide biosynthesis protein [bacterium]|nr:lasso peptide biosynthesis protein [bacterium]
MQKKNIIISAFAVAGMAASIYVELRLSSYLAKLPSGEDRDYLQALPIIFCLICILVLLNPGKYRRLLKWAWELLGKARASWAWYRENVRTFGQSFLFCRVALWSAVLVPYNYKHNSMPGFLKAITPSTWPHTTIPPEAEWEKWRINRGDRIFEIPVMPELEEKMRRINGYIVAILNQYPSQRNHMCFRRSLVLYHFLRAYGVPARWFLGVRKLDADEDLPASGTFPGIRSPGGSNGRYIGHAWVEINGRHYMDEMDGLRTYKVNFTFPDEKTYAEEVRRVYVKVKFEDLHLPRLTDLGGDGEAWFE